MEINPIRSTRDYEQALGRIDQLMDARPGSSEGDELEILSMLVEAYEERKFPIGLPDPIEAIRAVMEDRGLMDKDLVPFIGSSGRVSEVMSGKRGLSISMIRSLHEGLGIPAEVLIKEPRSA